MVENHPSTIEKKVCEFNRRHAPLEFVYEARYGGFALYRCREQVVLRQSDLLWEGKIQNMWENIWNKSLSGGSIE